MGMARPPELFSDLFRSLSQAGINVPRLRSKSSCKTCLAAGDIRDPIPEIVAENCQGRNAP